MRIKQESEILDIGTRKKIIEEINMTENRRRKDEYYKRYLCMKDQIYRFVIKMLERQFDSETVKEMSYSIANISVVKKVIEKLSRVYAYGVQRSIMDDDQATETLQDLAEVLDANTQLKTTNKLLKLMRNVALYIKPCPFYKDGQETWAVRLLPLAPYLYDVVEHHWDRTRPMVYILSNYEEQNFEFASVNPAREGRGINTAIYTQKGNQRDETIADVKEDQDKPKRYYTWWSDSYHFVTDETGAIVSKDLEVISNPTEEDILNPIEELPFVDFHIDQEGSYWAEGGDDIADSAILINSLMTNINHIGVVQGYGQFYMKGKNLPRKIALGPSKAILLEQEDKDEPEPEIGFASANPQLAALMQLLEMQVALLLTTNNLSTSGVSTQLGNNAQFPSGVAMLLDKADSMEDVKDQRQIFVDKEEDVWRKASKWVSVYTSDGTIDEEFSGLILPDEFTLNLEFGQPEAIVSEAEKLSNLEKRKDLGLNLMHELVQMDQPGLTKEQAENKLLEITKEKTERMASFVNNLPEETSEPEEDENDRDDSDREEDSEQD